MSFSLKARWGLVALVSLLFLASSAQAREGFYVGLGYGQQTVSGGLDGKKAFVSPDDTVALLAGKPDSGTGLGIVLGYGFTPTVALEYLSASTTHTAKHSLVNFTSSMTLTGYLLGVRMQIPVMENLEFVGRAGLAGATATYSKYALEGTNVSSGSYSTTSEATFSGSGFGLGAGIEYFVDKVSFSANYTILNVSFDSADGGGASGTLSSSLASTINQVTLLATYYFK